MRWTARGAESPCRSGRSALSLSIGHSVIAKRSPLRCCLTVASKPAPPRTKTMTDRSAVLGLAVNVAMLPYTTGPIDADTRLAAVLKPKNSASLPEGTNCATRERNKACVEPNTKPRSATAAIGTHGLFPSAISKTATTQIDRDRKIAFPCDQRSASTPNANVDGEAISM